MCTARTQPAIRKQRTAFTLVETVAAAVLSSLLIAIVISLLVALQRHDHSIRRFSTRSMQSSRLAEALRTDIRRATSVTAPSADEFTITAANGDVFRYTLVPEGCQRIQHAADTTKLSTEQYNIGLLASFQLEPGSAGRLPIYQVSLKSKPDTEGAPEKIVLVVHAALGADLPPVTNAPQ